MASKIDIAIVGAGAAGLAASIFACETNPNIKVALFDGARTIGAKILVSGGGRCNVTNVQVTPVDFQAPRGIVGRILKRFDEQATVRWFDSMNVPLKEEPTGKLFPVSNKARTVLDALLGRCKELGAQMMLDHRVKEITPTNDGFEIMHEKGEFMACRVIMATGGQSLPKSGSDGHGWSIAQRLGHTVTPTYPALVPLLLEDSFFHSGLSGISHEATITTRVKGKIVDQRTGSLLWTHFGVSGPVVLDASRFWVIATGQGHPSTVSINSIPGKTFKEVERWISDAARHPGRKTVQAFLSQQLPNRVVQAICTYAGESRRGQSLENTPTGWSVDVGGTAINKLPRAQRQALTETLTNLSLPVIGNRGWNHAEVTTGGIPLQEVNPQSMASRKVAGLYLIGEMLDCDGRIGGFNFQWAWSTGYIAGSSVAKELKTIPE